MYDLSLDKSLSGKALYEEILLLLAGLIEEEQDVLANLANTASLLFSCLPDLNWVGFYRACGSELILGPFQGKPACIRIPAGKGVCGKALSEKKVIQVDDVNTFSGHITCDVASKSEIVLPIILEEKVVAVLDIDSPKINRFDKTDREGLEKIVNCLVQRLDPASLFWKIPG